MKRILNGLFKTRKESETGKAVKAGFGYTIANFLAKGIAFFSIPIFSRIMTTSQYGVYSVFHSYEAILYVLIGLAMDLSVQNANIDHKKNINEYVSSITIIYGINAVIFCAINAIFGNWLSELLDLEPDQIYLLIIFSFSSAIIALYNMKVSLKYEYKKYLILSFLYSVGSVLLSLLLILTVFNERREYGRIIGATAAFFIAAIWVLYTMYKEAAPRINSKYWKYAIKYSLPLVPHGVSQVLLSHFDRIMIRQLVSDSAAGIYSLSTSVKLILTVITRSITTAWRTWFYKTMKQNAVEEIQKRSRQIVECYSIFTIGLMSISHEIIMLLGGQNYDAAKYVVVPMIMDAFILFIYSIVVQSEYYTKKTHFIMIGTIIATVINIVTNYFFIKKYGFVAAAYTTLFSYVIYLVLHLIISYRVIGFAVVPFKPLLFFISLVAADGTANLIFVDKMVIRLSICIVIVIITGIHFIKDTGILKGHFLSGGEKEK